MVTTARRPMTLEEYRALPDDGNRYELIDGELFVTAAPVPDHQDVLSAIVQLLLPATEAKRLGKLYLALIEVRLPTGDIAQPDLIYIRREHRHIRRSDAIVGVPDLVVEVLSPSTRATDLGAKRRAYETAGVPEYWIAEASRPGLRIYVLRDGRYVEVEATDGRLASTVVPGLLVDPVALYEAAMWATAE
jgi:Uma2 family endonuclease